MNTDTDDLIPFLVTPGFVDDKSLKLRFPEEYRAEISELLDEHGLEHSTAAEFSAEVELGIEVVRAIGTAGGLMALASVIKSFVFRHQGKRIQLDKEGTVVEMEGFSQKQVEKFLKKRAREQEELDREWKRMKDADAAASDDD